MGRVYEAMHDQIQRRVAIKILFARYAKNRKLTTRFLNEARAVNIVSHPTLVSIYEFGQMDDGTPYIVMEYLDGITLRQRLVDLQGRGLDSFHSIQIIRQIASGLAAAHAHRIVHRDLKPTNLMLLQDAEFRGGERVKILDFGVAKIIEPEHDPKLVNSQLTSSEALLGTPTYMAPEQCRDARAVTDRSDVYSLGVLAYELLSGQQPFRAATDIETMVRHINLVPPRLSTLVPEVEEGLSMLVSQMLEKSPLSRPSAEEIKQRLTDVSPEAYLTGAQPPVKVVGPSGAGFPALSAVRGPVITASELETTIQHTVPVEPGSQTLVQPPLASHLAKTLQTEERSTTPGQPGKAVPSAGLLDGPTAVQLPATVYARAEMAATLPPPPPPTAPSHHRPASSLQSWALGVLVGLLVVATAMVLYVKWFS